LGMNEGSLFSELYRLMNRQRVHYMGRVTELVGL